MRKAALALTALASLALSLAAAGAEPVWTTPGWYQVGDTIVGPVMLLGGGPFADEDTCKATLPPNEEDADYTCDYLTERPSWDD